MRSGALGSFMRVWVFRFGAASSCPNTKLPSVIPRSRGIKAAIICPKSNYWTPSHNSFARSSLMPKSVNKVILLGNLGKDPEVKYTPSGTPVAKLTLATNERFKDKEGQWQDRTEWHNVVLWQRLAEIAGEYLKKGSKVYIEGKLQTRSWEDKQTNQKKYMTEVVGNDLVLLSSRGEGGEASRGVAASSFDQRTPEPEPAPASVSPISDEDIPF